MERKYKNLISTLVCIYTSITQCTMSPGMDGRLLLHKVYVIPCSVYRFHVSYKALTRYIQNYVEFYIAAVYIVGYSNKVPIKHFLPN